MLHYILGAFLYERGLKPTVFLTFIKRKAGSAPRVPAALQWVASTQGPGPDTCAESWHDQAIVH
jgi:hypothetical protein